MHADRQEVGLISRVCHTNSTYEFHTHAHIHIHVHTHPHTHTHTHINSLAHSLSRMHTQTYEGSPMMLERCEDGKESKKMLDTLRLFNCLLPSESIAEMHAHADRTADQVCVRAGFCDVCVCAFVDVCICTRMYAQVHVFKYQFTCVLSCRTGTI